MSEHETETEDDVVELEDVLEELEETEEELSDAYTEIERLKGRVEELEAQRDMEGWEEWGKVSANSLTREDLTVLTGQAKVTEDVLVATFRRGVSAGIQMMLDHVERRIDDAWKPFAAALEESEDA